MARAQNCFLTGPHVPSGASTSSIGLLTWHAWQSLALELREPEWALCPVGQAAEPVG